MTFNVVDVEEERMRVNLDDYKPDPSVEDLDDGDDVGDREDPVMDDDEEEGKSDDDVIVRRSDGNG